MAISPKGIQALQVGNTAALPGSDIPENKNLCSGSALQEETEAHLLVASPELRIVTTWNEKNADKATGTACNTGQWRKKKLPTGNLCCDTAINIQTSRHEHYPGKE